MLKLPSYNSLVGRANIYNSVYRTASPQYCGSGKELDIAATHEPIVLFQNTFGFRRLLWREHTDKISATILLGMKVFQRFWRKIAVSPGFTNCAVFRTVLDTTTLKGTLLQHLLFKWIYFW